MTAERAGLTVLTNANVVPLDRAEVLREHTVVVAGDQIDAVGPAQATDFTPGARVIDCQGGYLMPGLADMHTHLAFRDPDPGHLVLYLAEGVTTVRSMSGLPLNQEWRAAIDRGDLIGPTILTAGNVIVDGLDGIDPETIAASPVFIPSSAEEAAEEVRRQAASWPDFVKVYDGLAEDRWLAAVAAATAAGIYVAGHVPSHLTRETIFNSGIDEIAHLDELNHCHWIGTPDEPGFRFDRDAVATTAELMAANDIGVVSNMVADEVLHQLIFDPEDVLSRPGYGVVRPEILAHWATEGRHLNKYADQGPYRRDLEMPFFKDLIRAINDAGAVVTVGTDSSRQLEGSVPSNIHRDIELLVESGLTPFDALAAATRNAAVIAQRMGCDYHFGTVVPGQRADLLLLEDNPLDDVGHTRHRVALMVRGLWSDQRSLDDEVEKFVSGY